MERNKRELALLYRIRELYIACGALHTELSAAVRIVGPWLANPGDKPAIEAILHSTAKTLAIEEGKQAADFENYQITLNSLDSRPKGKPRSWPRKPAR